MKKFIKAIYIDEYDYPLTDERIAKFPLSKRDSSKLLIYKNKEIKESVFFNLVDFLPENSLLVYNNTKVIQARILFNKETGAKIEVFCLEPVDPADYALSLGANKSCLWKCMIGNLKKWKAGKLEKEIHINNKSFLLSAKRILSENNAHHILFEWNNEDVHFAEILEAAGELPIPPYLNRKTEDSDKKNYQTVYSKIKGSVAAPTAGLHFTEEVLENLKTKNIETEELTLHVGAGTFQPVKSKDVAQHHMHTEVISVKKSSIEHLIRKLGNIIAVGTTSVRTLESLYFIGCQIAANKNIEKFHITQWGPYENEYSISAQKSLENIIEYLEKNNLDTLHADTQIMIKPAYEFRLIDGVISNFHQPKSTLLLLVSAFVGEDWKKIYDYALTHDFRFLSYGDSSLLLK